MPDIYLHDSDFDAKYEAITAKGMFGLSEAPVPVKDWAGLGTALRRQAKWGQAVFSFHGFDGGLTVGGNARNLNEKAVKDVFTPGGAKPPGIETIHFMGCNVGNLPTQMLAFAEIFGAKRVSGYTWYLVKQGFTVQFAKGTDEAAVKSTLDPFAPYGAGTLPAAKVIAATAKFKKHVVELVAYYGSEDGSSASTLPIPFGESKTRKPWTRAEQVEVAAAGAAKLETEIKGSPVTPFQRITVTR